MESDKLTGKLARWALILQEYDFQIVHRSGVANLDADGLNRNPYTTQEDDIGAMWHGEIDEEMVPDPEVEDGGLDQRDVHDDALVLEFLRTNHPEADGLAERVVQIVKIALCKYGLHNGHLEDWDIQVPWLAMEYRFSRQASMTSFSPYFLMYGQRPRLVGIDSL
ncbi:hypothetical protein AXG93_3490s1010 [Marchantia polymorpha subsp. ruderalis]|uniref:Reverse transcriptase RNase H-like domain-containing protein n=1 Tax=Marchantia polymorpha subsp. ruderalis TaxID=1480154 RepID=A0A176W0R1_MARPO|nr:hypothetical protein AXG93_3490s1010 [Marchantia polymorpha subsp. ruderalis]